MAVIIEVIRDRIRCIEDDIERLEGIEPKNYFGYTDLDKMQALGLKLMTLAAEARNFKDAED